MARFYATAHGQALGEVSRIGGPASGIGAHVRGWNVGVRVAGRAEGDADVFEVYATAGSNGGSRERHIGTVRLMDGTPTFEAALASLEPASAHGFSVRVPS